ncbi:putative 5-formyltetrahydrofolate cyclo-ligase [bacterium BMS3Abin06]|nr:putative 5-formyltetrahydrofolate cyclo-ligase [bacterium BMS3Abin06]
MKKRLRAKLLKKRDSIPPEQKVLKEAEIEKRLFALDAFKKAKSLLLYVSFRSEVDTTGYLNDVIKLGKKLILPAVDSRHKELKLYEVRDTSELVPGYMGIPEPGVRENRRATLKEIDLVIIPGTGFDVKGNRLGYGGGYYDRLLSFESRQLANADHHIMTIALAFEEQIGEKIPAEPHDIKVDIIITDKRLIYCNYPGAK